MTVEQIVATVIRPCFLVAIGVSQKTFVRNALIIRAIYVYRKSFIFYHFLPPRLAI